MNSVQAPREPPNYCLEYDHIEDCVRVASLITLFDPIKAAIGYLVPSVAACVSNQVELRKDDRTQERLLKSGPKEIVFKVVEDLKAAVGIERNIKLYTSLNYYCSSYGGTCSLTSPVISIPLYFLTKNGESLFDAEVEQPADQPPDYWRFTSDEVTFFIAREMAYIKSNDALLRIASKIFFIAAIFFIFTMSVPVLVNASLILGSGVLYLISERCVYAKLDIDAVNILTTYFGEDQNRAFQAAASALQKLIDQNIERKERKSCWNGFYLTKAGNNLLDLDHPFLTNRLERVREQFEAVPAVPEI
jgi:hypothetical protein